MHSYNAPCTQSLKSKNESDIGMPSLLFITGTQTVAPEPAGAHEWRHHEHDGRAAAAQHDQVRL